MYLYFSFSHSALKRRGADSVASGIKEQGEERTSLIAAGSSVSVHQGSQVEAEQMQSKEELEKAGIDFGIDFDTAGLLQPGRLQPTSGEQVLLRKAQAILREEEYQRARYGVITFF